MIAMYKPVKVCVGPRPLLTSQVYVCVQGLALSGSSSGAHVEQKWCACLAEVERMLRPSM
jgi:hypothetical protein